MPIRLGGLVSGLPPNIVETIMAQERIPIQTLEAKKVGINSKLQLIGDLETRMRSIGDTLKDIVGVGGFKDYALDLSREGIVSGSVDPDAAATGAWSVEVLKMPQNAGRMTNGFPDR
ncbi:MAG: flagellar hook associated protein, partial [Bdellovibrionales bacterium]|nr:flagellar hook associated protein [Bdellovibrionales bacterium]NQZ18853.1 flagellar hook associated protein [Bdellovibrionales bacterium]